jgi:hypothetical protein
MVGLLAQCFGKHHQPAEAPPAAEEGAEADPAAAGDDAAGAHAAADHDDAVPGDIIAAAAAELEAEFDAVDGEGEAAEEPEADRDARAEETGNDKGVPIINLEDITAPPLELARRLRLDGRVKEIIKVQR